MVNDTKPQDRQPDEVRREIDALLLEPLSDTDLRDRLEEVARARAFGGFTWLWGPQLYRRNRVVFRPFILNYFSNWLIKPKSAWERVEWKGEIGRTLDSWLQEVDADGDADVFRRLYPWKHGTRGWGALDDGACRRDLIARFRNLNSPAARVTELRKFDFGMRLDETSALELYCLDRRAAAPFILRHLGGEWGDNRALWQKLFDAARAERDDDFAFKVYRRQVGQKQWEAEVGALAKDVNDPEALCTELGKRHPEGWGVKTGMPLYRLVERRGREVFPYVQKHLSSVYRSWFGGRDGFIDLVKLAARNQWWDLWSALVRTCALPAEFNAEVMRLLKGARQNEAETEHRLLMLTGVSREWNFGPFGLAQVQQLEDPTAVRLYEVFPHLLHGPFKMNISSGWHAVLPKLTEAVIAARDEPLVDFLASRAVTRVLSPWGWGKEIVAAAERLSRYYEPFRDDDDLFSRRAVAVLSQVPAYSIWNYDRLIRTNRLARMFYARSAAKYLSHPVGVRDLLEAPEIHSQALAFRVLGLDCDAARSQAAQNVDLLQAALLRPLHRKTRLLTFRAIENAAVDLAAARRIERRCREALALPDKRYPKEQLIGLIGRLLYRWPELRSAREQPVVYAGG